MPKSNVTIAMLDVDGYPCMTTDDERVVDAVVRCLAALSLVNNPHAHLAPEKIEGIVNKAVADLYKVEQELWETANADGMRAAQRMIEAAMQEGPEEGQDR